MTSTAQRHTVDFDHHSAEFRDDNRGVLRRLHGSGCPLVWSPAQGGFWGIYGYEALHEAARDTEVFSSRHGPGHEKGVPAAPYPIPLIPIDADPPLVQEYRRVVLSRLSPAAAKADEPRIREICTELIDAFIERGECDLAQELLMPLPARWILEKLGWRAENWRQWIDRIHTTVHDRDADPDKAEEASEWITSHIVTEMTERREHAGDDLFGAILQTQVGDRTLDDAEIIGYSFLLLLGGMDTTAGLTGNVLEYLTQHPDVHRQLIADPTLSQRATEEFLRLQSPSYGLYRTVERDVEFHGQQLRRGDRVMLMFGAAGLDPHQYDDPETLDLARAHNSNMAFGLGPHRCLGSHHARVMFRVMLEEILHRLPDFEVSGTIERFEDSGDVYAIRHLPIRFPPAPRSTT